MSNDIRTFMNIMESSLLENPLTSLLSKIKRPTDKQQGEAERTQLVNQMKQLWDIWLGKTGLPGNADDMKKFLYSVVGFENNEISQIMKGEMSPPEQHDPDSSEPQDGPEDQGHEPENDNSDELDFQIDKITHAFQNVYKNVKGKIQSFLNSEDTGTLDVINKGIDLAIKYSNQVKPLSPETSSDLKKMIIDQLEILIKSNTLPPDQMVALKKKQRSLKRSYRPTNESLVEDAAEPAAALSNEIVDTILNNAARYVFINDLIGQNAPTNSASHSDAPAANANQGTTGGSPIKNRVKKNASAIGVPGSTFDDLEHLSNSKTVGFKGLQSDDKNALSAIGWAFLKSIN